MALLMMANDEGKPFFHDFFGVTCTDSSTPAVFPKKAVGETRLSEASASVGASSGGHGHVSPNSDLGSERQAGTNFEGVQFHGPKSDFSGTEISHKLSGRKRSNSDSTFMASTRDRILQMGPEPVESSRLMKMFSNEPGSERPRQSQEDELLFGMQPPKTASIAPLIRQAPTSNRSDLVVSNWERSVPMNLGPIVHYPSRLGQFAPYVDKHSSIRMKDISASTSLISPPAADEGSRTGIKGSGILNIINSGTGGSERHPSGVLLNNNRAKPGAHNIETEYASQPSRHSLTSTCHQMTIFYAGQAHVFDDVHPNKADAIMALAGSNGGSWSTTYSPKTSTRPPLAEAYTPSGENDASINNSRAAFSQDAQGRHSIVRTSSQGLGQVARISISNPGAHQGGRPVRDARIVAQAAEPDTDGKKEV